MGPKGKGFDSYNGTYKQTDESYSSILGSHFEYVHESHPNLKILWNIGNGSMSVSAAIFNTEESVLTFFFSDKRRSYYMSMANIETKFDEMASSINYWFDNDENLVRDVSIKTAEENSQA